MAAQNDCACTCAECQDGECADCTHNPCSCKDCTCPQHTATNTGAENMPTPKVKPQGMKALAKIPTRMGIQFRSGAVDRAKVNLESRSVDVAFSSEAPVDRWYGREILDHTPKSVR